MVFANVQFTLVPQFYSKLVGINNVEHALIKWEGIICAPKSLLSIIRLKKTLLEHSLLGISDPEDHE